MINTTAAPPSLAGPLEFSAGTVDEAVAAGLASLGLEAADAEVTVLARGGRGFLGIGTRKARVRIVPRSSWALVVQELAAGILARMGIEAQVTAGQNGRGVDVGVEAGENDGLLIGRRGETLQAFQHLVLRMASRRVNGKIETVRVDVGGYRGRRDEHLRREALELAERVAKTGRRAMTEPLPPEERRIVHRALVDRAEVRTHVGGSGTAKRVIIMPASREGR